MKASELKIGWNGSGNQVWLVFVMIDERCDWIHTFKTKSEAINWIKYA